MFVQFPCNYRTDPQSPELPNTPSWEMFIMPWTLWFREDSPHHHFCQPKLHCTDLDAAGALRIQICLMFPVFWGVLENAQIRSFGLGYPPFIHAFSSFPMYSFSSPTSQNGWVQICNNPEFGNISLLLSQDLELAVVIIVKCRVGLLFWLSDIHLSGAKAARSFFLFAAWCHYNSKLPAWLCDIQVYPRCEGWKGHEGSPTSSWPLWPPSTLAFAPCNPSFAFPPGRHPSFLTLPCPCRFPTSVSWLYFEFQLAAILWWCLINLACLLFWSPSPHQVTIPTRKYPFWHPFEVCIVVKDRLYVKLGLSRGD